MASLTEYRRKRRFESTPEPSGDRHGSARQAQNRFVIQKHDATRLHYDFRLEVDGVLKSWAVPKGPSLNPKDKRLAMQTEDHPLEYASFEGVIPEGHYGAGPVIVWDNGTFEPEGNLSAQDQLDHGELKFTLHGQKIRGSFVLVKLQKSQGKGKPWLLIKHADGYADPAWDIDEHDGSVLSSRKLADVEQGVAPSHAAVRTAEELDGAKRARIPTTVKPMLATLVAEPFSHPDWLFEIKWDGIRALAWIKDGRLELHSRTGRSITHQYPELVKLPEHISAKTAILDGEIVVLDRDGRSDFERLQSRMNVRTPTAALIKQAPVCYYLFDLIYCDGYDLRNSPLIQRKQLLRQLLQPGGPFHYADHHEKEGKELFRLAKRQGLEGIVGKQRHSFYVEKRSPQWVKFKITQDVDAVIGGYTAPRGSRGHFGALLVGLYDGSALRWIGGVGTGFDEHTQRSIFDQLKKLETKDCSFAEKPQTAERATWVKPELVARIKYGSWTRDRKLRAPVFIAMLQERKPTDCKFETQLPIERESLSLDADDNASHAPEAAGIVKSRSGAHERSVTSEKEIEQELFEGHANNVVIELDGRKLPLTNLNKIYFPESGYTKRDVLAYYYKIADYLLPFLKDRPLVLRRYPDGITAEAFFQKNAGEHAPKWMETVAIRMEKGTIRYFIANDRASLLYVTNLGCIDHNPWASRRDALDKPDYVFFDLDPTDGTDFDTVVTIARAIHEKLVSIGLKVFLKTSGATGFHLSVPLERKYSYEQTRMFAEVIGQLVGREYPKLVTHQRIISKRAEGTVLIDAYQNASDHPLPPPYVIRPFPGAPVSAPLLPNELRKGLRPGRFHIKNIFERLEQKGDLWANFWKERQRLEPAIEKLESH